MRLYAFITDLSFSGNIILHPIASGFAPLHITSLDFNARVCFG